MEEFFKKNGTNIAIGLVVAVVIYFMFFNTEGFAGPMTCAPCTTGKKCYNGNCVTPVSSGKSGHCYTNSTIKDCSTNDCLNSCGTIAADRKSCMCT